ncbi:hypothetical protein [Lacinutrix sp. Bg11-31]|uniref:hypothetical protein n=1 Tax=Lacinutrix sp. Bg11-31 TaxID=2057808 RepID=UPI0012FD8366|nr:hypothetical protein [Lacinutrix sp. Bg11-31]
MCINSAPPITEMVRATPIQIVFGTSNSTPAINSSMPKVMRLIGSLPIYSKKRSTIWMSSDFKTQCLY